MAIKPENARKPAKHPAGAAAEGEVRTIGAIVGGILNAAKDLPPVQKMAVLLALIAALVVVVALWRGGTTGAPCSQTAGGTINGGSVNCSTHGVPAKPNG